MPILNAPYLYTSISATTTTNILHKENVSTSQKNIKVRKMFIPICCHDIDFLGIYKLNEIMCALDSFYIAVKDLKVRVPIAFFEFSRKNRTVTKFEVK
jgi:hypothetical protein